jgi:hypothetical protein
VGAPIRRFMTRYFNQYFGHFLSERGERMRPQTG